MIDSLSGIHSLHSKKSNILQSKSYKCNGINKAVLEIIKS